MQLVKQQFEAKYDHLFTHSIATSKLCREFNVLQHQFTFSLTKITSTSSATSPKASMETKAEVMIAHANITKIGFLEQFSNTIFTASQVQSIVLMTSEC